MQIFYEEKCNTDELLEMNKRAVESATRPAARAAHFNNLFNYGDQLIRHDIYGLGLEQFEKALEVAGQANNYGQFSICDDIDTHSVKVIIKTLFNYFARLKHKTTISDTLDRFLSHAMLTSLNGFIESIIADEASRNECLELRKQKQLKQLIGVSTQWLLVLNNINTFSCTDKLILINGPSGIGKELIAQAIGSIRGHGCIAINCAAISDALVESLMFGHKRGSFTGATIDHVGFCEKVGKGVLFLDEIDKASKKFQSALLRLLEENEFYRVGDTAPKQFFGTIISATSRNLSKLVQNADSGEVSRLI